MLKLFKVDGFWLVVNVFINHLLGKKHSENDSNDIVPRYIIILLQHILIELEPLLKLFSYINHY